MTDTRLDRGAWFVLGGSICLILIILSLNIYRFRLPTDGWVYEDGAGLTDNILGLTSKIQSGDLPVSINGLAFDPNKGLDRGTWNPGDMVQYTVMRGGQKLTFSVPIGSWNLAVLWKEVLANWNSYLIGLLYFLIGLFVFVRGTGNQAARVLLFLGVVRLSMTLVFFVPLSISDLSNPVSRNGIVLLGFFIWGLLLFPTLFLLSLVFPKPKWTYRTHSALTVMIIYLVEPLLILLVGGPFSDMAPAVGFGMVAVFGLLALISAIHTLITGLQDPVSRAQARWVGLGIALVAGYQFLSNVIGFIFVSTSAFNTWWVQIIDTLVFLALPVTIGIAILRFRLFDIDLIIRRTLSYTILTGLLVLTYFGGIVILQDLLGPLTGDTRSPLVTVITTLAIAALFNPLRGRIQRWIDRRFYRSEYDAEEALAGFARAARDEVDLDVLSMSLVAVVNRTMKPARASLWLGEQKSKNGTAREV